MQIQEAAKALNTGGGHQSLAPPDGNPFQGGNGEAEFYLSKSRLNRYITCPRSYQLHYDLGIVPLRPDRDLLIGRSTHRLIAAHHLARKKEEFIDAQGVLDGFWSMYTPEGEEADATIRQEMETARTESLRYAQLFIRDIPLDPLEIERDFSLPLVDLENGDTLPVPLVGVIDLVDQPNGVLRPLEIKTRARKADAWQVRLALAYLLRLVGPAADHGKQRPRARRNSRWLRQHHQDQNPHNPVADGLPYHRRFYRPLPHRPGRL